jgi:hypothetical protein
MKVLRNSQLDREVNSQRLKLTINYELPFSQGKISEIRETVEADPVNPEA